MDNNRNTIRTELVDARGKKSQKDVADIIGISQKQELFSDILEEGEDDEL